MTKDLDDNLDNLIPVDIELEEYIKKNKNKIEGNKASDVNVLNELASELVNKKTELPLLDRKKRGSPFWRLIKSKDLEEEPRWV